MRRPAIVHNSVTFSCRTERKRNIQIIQMIGYAPRERENRVGARRILSAHVAEFPLAAGPPVFLLHVTEIERLGRHVRHNIVIIYNAQRRNAEIGNVSVKGVIADARRAVSVEMDIGGQVAVAKSLDRRQCGHCAAKGVSDKEYRALGTVIQGRFDKLESGSAHIDPGRIESMMDLDL